MSFLHAQCEKEIAVLKQELEESKKKCEDLSVKYKKKEDELKKQKKSLNQKVKDIFDEMNEKDDKISELEKNIVENDNSELIESYKKVIENIASIITPTDYKIIETISTLDDGQNNFIIDENLPEIQVKLEIEKSNDQLTMQAINNFINLISKKLSSFIQSIDLEQIETSGNKTNLDFNIKYRSTFEDITAFIVEFCQSHFMITYRGSYSSIKYDNARKPIILKSSKKDRLLKLNLIPVI